MKEYKFENNDITYDRIIHDSLTEAYDIVPNDVKVDFYNAKFNDGKISTVVRYKRTILGVIAASSIEPTNENEKLGCNIYGFGAIDTNIEDELFEYLITLLKISSKRVNFDMFQFAKFEYSYITAVAANKKQATLLEKFGFVYDNGAYTLLLSD
jgi:hypothetical protein